MHGSIIVTREMDQVVYFRSSLPGASDKEDGGTPDSAPVDKRLSHVVAPRSDVHIAGKLHHAGACYV